MTSSSSVPEVHIGSGSEEFFDFSRLSFRTKTRPDYKEYSHDEEEDDEVESIGEPRSKRSKMSEEKKKMRRKRRDKADQKQKRVRFSEEEVAEMWLYIIDHIRDPATQKVSKLRQGSAIWKAFKDTSKSDRNELSFYVHFRRSMIPSLDDSTFDMQTKTLLHYALEIPCTDEFLNKLREEEQVEAIVNQEKCITAYRKLRPNGIVEDDGWDDIWEGRSGVSLDLQRHEGYDHIDLLNPPIRNAYVPNPSARRTAPVAAEESATAETFVI